MDILLSKVTTPVINWISQLMGWIMNGIYTVLDAIGIPNMGVTIILYTIVVYMLMLPLQIRQQKSSKMMSLIQPEIQKVQEKYKGRRDTASRQAMSAETMEVYSKYGVSMYGSCLTLVIQLPLIIGLYQVIYHIPGYITKIRELLGGLASGILGIAGGGEAFTTFISENSVRVSVANPITENNVIDALYLMSRNSWSNLSSSGSFSSLSAQITQTSTKLESINSFLGMNIQESTLDTIKNAFSDGKVLILIAAVLIPVLAWFTQWLNYKLMPQAGTPGADDANPMGGSMKMMNTIMPLFSAFICLSLSVGIGIYWIAGAIIRSVQMVVINRHYMKVDLKQLLEEKKEKAAKKNANKPNAVKAKDATEVTRVVRQANVNTKGKYVNDGKEVKDYSHVGESNPNSIFSKVNMVSRYNEANPKNAPGSHSGKKNKKKK